MELKNVAVACTFTLACGYLAGVYGSPSSRSESKEQTREREVSQSHSTTTTTVIETPNGEKKTVTVIDTTTRAESDKKTKATTKEVTEPVRKATNISLIGAYDFSNRGPLQYGISVTREVAGPLTIGAFGLQNGTVGISLGVNF